MSERVSRRHFFRRTGELGLGLVATLASSALVGCGRPKTPRPATVEIPAGEAIVGRTEQQAEAAYNDCKDMVGRTNQSPQICEPKKEVFGDVVPQRKVNTQGIRIDKFEHHDENNYPIRVDFEEAKKICKDQGGRLSTSDEWEIAARGLDGRRFPWGDEPPVSGDANIDAIGGFPERPVEPVGSYPKDVTPEGVYDMLGNGREWTIGENGQPVGKGGNPGTYTVFAEPAHKIPQLPTDELVFRCVYPTNH